VHNINVLQAVVVPRRAAAPANRPRKHLRLDESLGYLVRKAHYAIVARLDERFLEHRGFVERRFNGSGRCKRYIYLTPSARKLVAVLRPHATEVNDIALADLSNAETTELMRLLHRVFDSLLRAASVEHNALEVSE
jgi:hypothetical protein